MRSTTLALCALILAAPCSTAFAQAAAQDQQGQHGFLSPELRVLLREEQPRGDVRSMTPDQRTAMREQMRAQWESMSPADKEALKARLQAKWDSLSPAEKQAIEQKIADRMTHWQNHGQ